MLEIKNTTITYAELIAKMAEAYPTGIARKLYLEGVEVIKIPSYIAEYGVVTKYKVGPWYRRRTRTTLFGFLISGATIQDCKFTDAEKFKDNGSCELEEVCL